MDCSDIPLATNQLSRDIQFDRLYMKIGTENQTISNLQMLFRKNECEWIDNFPIICNESGEYSFAEDSDNAISSLKTRHRFQQYATAEQIMAFLIEKYECSDYSPQEARDIIAVRDEMDRKDFSTQYPYTFASNVSPQMVVIIEENSELLVGVSVANSSVRCYPQENVAAHVVGVTGAINQTEYAKKKSQGYRITDVIGKFGIEQIAETYLRGQRGTVSSITNPDGTIETQILSEPTPGNSVKLTIDSKLQRIAQKALDNTIQKIIANGVSSGGGLNSGADCTGGAVIVQNCKTGAILVMASNPGFSLSTYSTDLFSLQEDTKGTPLVNRAINATYQPGSVMKVSSAFAGLSEKAITPSSIIVCNHIMNYGDTKFQCLGLHGSINVSTALGFSCNIFFYNVGLQVGIDKLNEYSRKLGLGEKTGVELPENVGILAGRNDSVTVAQGGEWYPGNTMQAAIGQSHNLFTPIQIASYISTVVNGGIRYRSHLIDSVISFDHSRVIMKNDPEIIDQVEISSRNLEAIKLGMRKAITEGSANYALANYPIAVGGKTGTAQTSGGSDHGLISIFAPYDDPEIVVVVVLEHGVHGYTAAETVRTILDAYFYGIGYDNPSSVDSDPIQIPTENIPE